MADIGSNIKGLWLKGMEAIGNAASSIANNTRSKVDEINLVNRRTEILRDFGNQAYALWQKGERFPEELEARLQELEKLDEQLNDLRAERLAGVKTAKAPEETSDKAEQNEQEASEDDETASAEETAEDAQESPVPVIRVESEAEPGQPGSGLSEAINDLFERVPSVNEAQDKVNQALDSLEEGLSQAGDRVDQALQELDDTLKGSPEK